MKPPYPIDHRRYATGCLLLLFVVAVGLKLGVAIGNEPLNLDAVRYINAARLVSQGQLLEALAISQFMPLLPLLIWGVHLLLGDWVLSGQIVSALFLSLTILPVFLLTRRLFDGKIAFWSAVACALSPSLTGYGAQILREPPFFFFLASALYFAVRAFDRVRPGDFLLTGLFALLAASCRLEGLLFPVVCAGWILFLIWRNPERKTPLLRGAVLLGAPFLLLLAAATLGGVNLLRLDYVGSLSGQLFSAQGFRGFLDARQALIELEQVLPGGQWANDFAATARNFLPLIYFLGLMKALLNVLYPPFAVLAAVGFWRRGKPGRGFSHLVAGVYLVTGGLFLLRMNFISDRYLLSAALPLFPFVGAGFQQILEKAGQGSRSLLPKALVVLFLLIPLGGSLRQIDAGDPSIRLAGEWLGGREFQGDTLICNDERVPFYAGRWRGDYLQHPVRDFRRMGAIASEGGIDLMIVRISARQHRRVAAPEGYGRLRDFIGKKDAVLIFRRQQAAQEK
ncbi:MAG: glycosyltransferase family 39 protein [Desulfuromonadales bacterium]